MADNSLKKGPIANKATPTADTGKGATVPPPPSPPAPTADQSSSPVATVNNGSTSPNSPNPPSGVDSKPRTPPNAQGPLPGVDGKLTSAAETKPPDPGLTVGKNKSPAGAIAETKPPDPVSTVDKNKSPAGAIAETKAPDPTPTVDKNKSPAGAIAETKLPDPSLTVDKNKSLAGAITETKPPDPGPTVDKNKSPAGAITMESASPNAQSPASGVDGKVKSDIDNKMPHPGQTENKATPPVATGQSGREPPLTLPVVIVKKDTVPTNVVGPPTPVTQAPAEQKKCQCKRKFLMKHGYRCVYYNSELENIDRLFRGLTVVTCMLTAALFSIVLLRGPVNRPAGTPKAPALNATQVMQKLMSYIDNMANASAEQLTLAPDIIEKQIDELGNAIDYEITFYQSLLGELFKLIEKEETENTITINELKYQSFFILDRQQSVVHLNWSIADCAPMFLAAMATDGAVAETSWYPSTDEEVQNVITGIECTSGSNEGTVMKFRQHPEYNELNQFRCECKKVNGTPYSNQGTDCIIVIFNCMESPIQN